MTVLYYCIVNLLRKWNFWLLGYIHIVVGGMKPHLLSILLCFCKCGANTSVFWFFLITNNKNDWAKCSSVGIMKSHEYSFGRHNQWRSFSCFYFIMLKSKVCRSQIKSIALGSCKWNKSSAEFAIQTVQSKLWERSKHRRRKMHSTVFLGLGALFCFICFIYFIFYLFL